MMRRRTRGFIEHKPRRVAVALGILLLMAFGSLVRQGMAQSQQTGRQKDPFSRPTPVKPLKPTIPTANRYRSDRVFLEKADSLYKHASDTVTRQIVSGNVVFRHGNMWMYCDSAYYYPDRNSMDAFGHVKMVQGDTLFVYSDKLYYDGDARFARLFRGITEPKVKLKDPQGTLLTDTLYYDLNTSIGSYGCGGILEDQQNTLSSIYGQYSTATHDADFFYDVELLNRRDGYRLLSDTLYYNTSTGLARIDSPTRIYGKSDTIHTAKGWYDTNTDNLELLSRSLIAHTDSAGRTTTIEGDSIVYDKARRVSRAYTFEGLRGTPVVLTDTANKMRLTGLFGLYNDSTREAMSTGYPLLKEYSRPDTIYLRADTIRTFIVTERVWPEGLDSLARRFTPPNPDYNVFETPEWKAPEMTAADSATLDSALMLTRDFHIARAYNRARFFNRDLQGVADSMIFVERDSMLRMYRKPVVWNELRQVSGGDHRNPGEIWIHFNDTTSDWAILPSGGLMTEQVDSADYFYNQLAARKMKAWFKDRTLSHLDASGNVQTLFLPQEEDSTYNRLVLAESSFMTLDIKENDIDRIKMWPEVTGNVTPLFLVTPRQKVLEGFEGRLWMQAIRPKGILLGNRIVWDDDLGEPSEELERYFSNE